MANNSENSDWNDRYGGSRVPVNDTGLPGAPFALGSSLAEWKLGSANKAVYDTITIDKDFPETDDLLNAVDGAIDLAHLALYVIPDMLYGYIGDARNRVPNDQMSYRGYPTPVVADFTLTLESASSGFYINYDGSSGASQDNIVLAHSLTLFHKLPYNTEYTVEYLLNTVSKLKISIVNGIGELNASTYTITEIEGVVVESPEALPLPLGSIFFSLPIEGLAGTQTFQVNLLEFSGSDPYYGAIANQTVAVLEAEYSPTNNWRSLGFSTRLLDSFDMTYYLNTCSEINKLYLTAGISGELFISKNDVIQIGTTLYSNSDLTITALPGKYLWTEYAYTTEEGVYFRIQSYVQIGALGVVVLNYPDVSTIGSLYCAIGGPPPQMQ